MRLQTKNRVLALVIGAVAIGLYVYAIYHVVSGHGLP